MLKFALPVANNPSVSLQYNIRPPETMARRKVLCLNEIANLLVRGQFVHENTALVKNTFGGLLMFRECVNISKTMDVTRCEKLLAMDLSRRERNIELCVQQLISPEVAKLV
ncbi:hypothetical protein TNCV_5068521 [Trichonephila clavipes]|nr:hypothetical protein TNCV_5068521 [Trichonephila clavipes]